MSRITLEPIHGGEIRSQVFDFTSQCAVGETISSSTATATVYSGTDPTPSAILTGATSNSGQKVTQQLGGSGGITGVVYLVTIDVTASTGQKLKLIAYLPFIPASQ